MTAIISITILYNSISILLFLLLLCHYFYYYYHYYCYYYLLIRYMPETSLCSLHALTLKTFKEHTK